MSPDPIRPKVVVVDDEEDICNLLKELLVSSGCEVLTESDGARGLALIRKEKPDLIVLDVMLPKLNGYKISRLLKFDSRYKDIPIIMLTSRETKRDEQIGLDTGADEYVYKSDRTGKLLKTIRHFLDPASASVA